MPLVTKSMTFELIIARNFMKFGYSNINDINGINEQHY